ncbi:hypothetical protein [Paenibacillus sp. LK1]|nr:hypothetical protein [Paenibacillus sp. LK1]
MDKLTVKQMDELIQKHPELVQYIQFTGRGHLIAQEVIEKFKQLNK